MVDDRIRLLETQLAEQAVRLSQRERDLRAILDNMPSMIGYWDRNLRNRFGNNAYVSWFGIRPEDMPGKHIREVIGEERYALNRPYMDAALRGEAQRFERAIPSPDGRCIRYSLADYIPDIHDGKVQGFFVLVSDVTPLKETEMALRDSETRFRKLFEDSAEPLLLLEGDRFVEANAAAAQLLGLEDRAAIGGLCLADVSPSLQPDGAESGPKAAQMIAAAYTSGSNRFEWECQRRDGSHFVAAVQLTSIHATDRQLLHMVLRDITAEKAMEAELRRSNAELESFAYAASHDLRQPLRMISSYLGLLAKEMAGRLNEDEQGYFSFAIAGAKRLDRMIVGLLGFSRIGRSGLAKAPVALDEVLDLALDNLAVAIDECGAVIVRRDRLPVLLGHATELERLFQNLIGNGIKFQAPGRIPRVEIACRETTREWVVAISDNGIGIPPDSHHRLFNVFQRLVGTEEYEGTGIGLASCRKIVERHGGRIWVESAEGKGSTFLLGLPKGGAAGRHGDSGE